MISMYEASGTPTESMLFTSAKLTFFVSLLSMSVQRYRYATVSAHLMRFAVAVP